MPPRANLRAGSLLRPSAAVTGALSATATPPPAAYKPIPKLAAAAAAVARPYSSSSSLSQSTASTTSPSASSSSIPEPPPPRWHSDLHKRLGKCILFGCAPPQVAAAGKVLGALATEWRELLAGSEGFLTGGRRGLQDQQVVWGEQDSFVRTPIAC